MEVAATGWLVAGVAGLSAGVRLLSLDDSLAAVGGKWGGE